MLEVRRILRFRQGVPILIQPGLPYLVRISGCVEHSMIVTYDFVSLSHDLPFGTRLGKDCASFL